MKNMKFIFILTFCLLLSGISNISFAKDNAIDVFEQKCIAKNWTTSGMTDCSYKAYEMWDKELNKYYSLLMKKLTPVEQNELKSSQISWINFRDKEFKNINNIFNKLDGTMYIPIRVQERNEIVKQRALQLKYYYDTLSNN